MSIRVNIENILKSPDETFENILSQITSDTLNRVKTELKIKIPTKDTILFDAITLILKNLESEESYISRLLYRLFGIELRENVRRKQLLILGGELKSQYSNIEKRLYATDVNLDNIASTIAILQKLKRAFRDKILFLVDKRLIKRADSYIEKIDRKILKLKGYKERLLKRKNLLIALRGDYKRLLRKIPRYHELNSSVDNLLEGGIRGYAKRATT